MWFKNLLVYRLAPDWSVDLAALNEKLSRLPLQGCGSFEMNTRGWRRRTSIAKSATASFSPSSQ